MDDTQVAQFWRMGAPGTLSWWCRWLIGAAAVTTIVVAYHAWHVLWDLYGCSDRFYEFWVRNGVWLGLTAAVLAAFIPRSRTSRFIRLATLLPVFHLVAVVASVALWLPIKQHASEWDRLDDVMAMPIEPATGIAIATGILVGGAWLIQRRDWLQSTLVLALSFLLVLGAWLPFSAVGWFNDSSGFHYVRPDLHTTLIAPAGFLEDAILLPLVAALVFTLFAMRRPAFTKSVRPIVITLVSMLLLVGVASQIGDERDSTVLYLNATVLVLLAQGLAIGTLAFGVIAMSLRARRERTQLRGLRSEPGVIIDQDGDRETVVELEIVGWLRAPRVHTSPFEVATTRGRVPVAGAPVLWSVPIATTRLAVGEQTAVLHRGDAVALYFGDDAATDHPFRSANRAEVQAVAAPSTGTGFENMTLMLWRPATAYLAIALAVVLPAVLALLAR